MAFRTMVFGIFLLTVFIFTAAASAQPDQVELKSVFVHKLEPKDQVLGDVTGNFIVYGRPHVSVFNAKGEALFSRKLTNNIKPAISDNGEFVGLATYADRNPTSLKTTDFALFNPSGSRIGHIDKPSANNFKIASNGTILATEGTAGLPPTFVYIYSKNGDRRTMLKYQSYHALVISPSGKRFAVDKGPEGMEIYNDQGESIVELPSYESYAFDNRKDFFGVFADAELSIYDDKEILHTLRAAEYRIIDVQFDVDADVAAIMSERRLEVYRISSGQLLWELRLPNDEKWFTSIAISPDGKKIAAGIDINLGPDVPKESRHVEGDLYLFSVDGQLLARHRENYQLWSKGIPYVCFSDDDEVVVVTREKIEKFEIRQ